MPQNALVCSLLLTAAAAWAADDGFVAVPAGGLTPATRVEAFEILDHPLTNAEYKEFVDAAAYAAPHYWEGGRIPPGMEQHPVVFVNRADARAYLAWRTKKEGRIYRLPTAAEYDYAARGGNPKAQYPWGGGSVEGKANYDPDGKRTFAQWRQFLKPVRSYQPNAWGLFDMAGNVWQMVLRWDDPVVRRYLYRLDYPEQKENTVAGGSWARSAYYLRCGVTGGVSGGIRHPDLGFRPVREPAGSTHFRTTPRRLAALPAGGGAVFLSWQMLKDDAPSTGFHVYRATRRDVAGERITSAPVRDSSNYVDQTPPQADRVHYRVRPVGANGKEGPPSEWAGVEPAAARTGLVASYEGAVKQGTAAPVFGDLDGDGVLDAVLKLNNNIREMSVDPGVPVELQAFTSFGRSLWRRALVWHDHCYGNSNNVPVAVYDLDGDGKSEVIAMIQEDGGLFLAVLDGMTGRVKRKTPWDPMETDFAGSSTRVHMSIAHLDGRTPAILTQTGLYENEKVSAYDASLNRLWQYKSFYETNGSGSHHLDIADVDGDGRDDVLLGTTALNPDGTMKWSIYRQHPDIVAVKHILPGAKDRQVYYVVESSVHAGAYVVDAKSGAIIWKVNREDDPRWVHAHIGWASDIWEGSPGMEMLTNRDGHLAKDTVLFAADGRILANPFPGGWRPVNWTGGKVRELLAGDGRRLGRFNGKEVETLPGPPPTGGRGGCSMVADLVGDFRDEIVCIGATSEGAPLVEVYTNIEPVSRREVTRTSSHEYRLWLARNIGAGYGAYFEFEP